ncbi:MAG: beta-lactamase family protein [Bacteroidales bacterium]|nr:beta-lactamase family protein [Bacteroidales bacterium]
MACSEALDIKPNKSVAVDANYKTGQISEKKIDLIDKYFTLLFESRVFNGNVLIAQHGKVVFEKPYGYSDIRTKDSLKIDDVFQIGSVSKQFTAVAILQLYARGLLDLNDTIQKYIPNFPYRGITIDALLCHRSGLPNYIYFCDALPIVKSTPLSNRSVVQCLSDSMPPAYYPPNKRFDYSNTGYIVLAYIVEKLSGQSFANYMKSNVFEPLGMKHTYVFNFNQPYYPNNLVKGYEYGKVEANPDFLDGVVGDKGIYTTAFDLFLWDNGLYTGKILNVDTLELAFKPHGKKISAPKNYGYGWRIYYLPDSSRVLYHAGWWHGYQSLLVRYEKDTTTLVVLKNKRSKQIIDQNRILEILSSD